MIIWEPRLACYRFFAAILINSIVNEQSCKILTDPLHAYQDKYEMELLHYMNHSNNFLPNLGKEIKGKALLSTLSFFPRLV